MICRGPSKPKKATSKTAGNDTTREPLQTTFAADIRVSLWLADTRRYLELAQCPNAFFGLNLVTDGHHLTVIVVHFGLIEMPTA